MDAYRRLVRATHPDATGRNDRGTAQQFAAIHDAYQLVTQPGQDSVDEPVQASRARGPGDQSATTAASPDAKAGPPGPSAHRRRARGGDPAARAGEIPPAEEPRTPSWGPDKALYGISVTRPLATTVRQTPYSRCWASMDLRPC